TVTMTRDPSCSPISAMAALGSEMTRLLPARNTFRISNPITPYGRNPIPGSACSRRNRKKTSKTRKLSLRPVEAGSLLVSAFRPGAVNFQAHSASPAGEEPNVRSCATGSVRVSMRKCYRRANCTGGGKIRLEEGTMGRKRELRRSTYPPVVAYEEDVHAWMYLDQVDGVLRYEAYVIGYDETGSPTTLEFVIEEGVLDLRRFPQIFPFLPRALRRRLEGATGSQGDAGDHTDAAARDGAAGARAAGEQESARERAADYRGDAGQGKADGPSAPAAEPWNP